MTETATPSAPASILPAPQGRQAQTIPGRSYLSTIVREYQNECARRAVLCMKGHNRQGAKAWAARCASLGEWRSA